MYKIQIQVIDKVNENQEADVPLYTWESIPYSLRKFWVLYFANQKKSINQKK